MDFKRIIGVKGIYLLLFITIGTLSSACSNKNGDSSSNTSFSENASTASDNYNHEEDIVLPPKSLTSNKGDDDVILLPLETKINKEKKEEKITEHKPSTSKVSSIEIPVMDKSVPRQLLKRYAYTLSYNRTTRCPNWVAWKLTANHTDGPYIRRNYDFHEDIDVPSPRAIPRDYSGNSLGLERGHMCPAGDNKWADRAMDECHLLSNICPQSGDLNGGAWKKLEEDCREWANTYDCIYIVCGPIFYGKGHRTIGEDKVSVPDAFFKVILRLGKNPQALGFIYPNKRCPGGKGKYAMSVDKVEDILGIDFFSSLDDGVENKVEQSYNLNLWR